MGSCPERLLYYTTNKPTIKKQEFHHSKYGCISKVSDLRFYDNPYSKQVAFLLIQD